MELERKLESVTTTTVDNDVNYCYTVQKIELSDESIAKLANALVKHGYWEFHAKSIKDVPTEACSECGEWSYGDNEAYCPCCGAKMDEEIEDEID